MELDATALALGPEASDTEKCGVLKDEFWHYRQHEAAVTSRPFCDTTLAVYLASGLPWNLYITQA